jgi:hypothetical protein
MVKFRFFRSVGLGKIKIVRVKTEPQNGRAHSEYARQETENL